LFGRHSIAADGTSTVVKLNSYRDFSIGYNHPL
jgi:hypothetical protein